MKLTKEERILKNAVKIACTMLKTSAIFLPHDITSTSQRANLIAKTAIQIATQLDNSVITDQTNPSVFSQLGPEHFQMDKDPEEKPNTILQEGGVRVVTQRPSGPPPDSLPNE
jgi:hypothetical protein